MDLTGSVGLYASTAPERDQLAALREGEVPVAVYGLGKMGLPLAAVYADVTGNVVGADVDPAVVAGVNEGECHVANEPGLPELVAETVDRGALRATDDLRAAARGARVHVLIVPTPLTGDDDPDLSVLESACTDLAAGLTPGDLVVVECTVPPRTTAGTVRPLLAAESGLDRGTFGVAFCPERTSSGRALADIRGSHPKVVGGVDEESGRVAELLYGEVTANEVIRVADATTAECVKLFEGIYRDVNIALANELATFADELDVDVRAAATVANTQPYCDIHDPGPGVGGHCIPWYPYFLTATTETPAPLVGTARAVNDSMPAFTVERTLEGLRARGPDPADATVLVLGLTYRPGVAETRATPARPVVEALAERCAAVHACDPVLPEDVVAAFPADPVAVDAVYDLAPDAVVVVTPHAEFDDVDWDALPAAVVVDGRASYDLVDSQHSVYTIGGGWA